MPFSIALAGKGGTGKTTVAGMLIKYLIKMARHPSLQWMRTAMQI